MRTKTYRVVEALKDVYPRDSRHLQFGGHRSGHGAYRAARRHHLRVEPAQGAKDFILQRTWVAAVAAKGAHTVAGRGYGDGELSVPGKAFQIHRCQHWRHLVRSDTRHIPPQIELSRRASANRGDRERFLAEKRAPSDRGIQSVEGHCGARIHRLGVVMSCSWTH